MTESRKQLAKRLQRATYAYTMGYLEELDNQEKEAQAIREFEENENDEPVCIITTAENNVKVMLECIREMKEAIDILLNENEDVDEWMIAGVNAMCDKANEMGIIPYDLPTAILGALGAQYRK